MTGSEIISAFELYVDDATELNAVDELTLANKVYKKILRNKPWEFLKKTATGTLSMTVPYVALPSDFSFMAENNQTTDISVGIDNNASPKVVFVIKNGSYNPYQIINFSDRRQYLNKDGYAYVDLANSRLIFTLQPTTAYSYEFDYIYMPTDITLSTSPIFPTDFHPMIYHGMAVEHDIIILFEKARSYAPENQAKYNDYMRDLAYYNSNLILN